MEDVAVYGPGEGERYTLGRSTVTLKATGEHTAGRFFLSESVLEPGFPGPPPHRHRELHDMFYVLEGTLTITIGRETRKAPAGTFVCIPPGVRHAFRNVENEPVRFLNFTVPGGFENYMRELGALSAEGKAPSPEEIGRVASRHDFEPA